MKLLEFKGVKAKYEFEIFFSFFLEPVQSTLNTSEHLQKAKNYKLARNLIF